MKKIIFLDLDDTLADTTQKVIDEFGIQYFSIHQKSKIIINFYSILKIWKKIKNDPSFWVNLPLKKDAHIIYEKSKKITSNVHILTALPILFYKKGSKSFNLATLAKIEWVKKHFPEIPEENIHVCYSKEKHLMIKNVTSNYILVDDSPTNIKKWIKAGGVGILVKSDSQSHLIKLDEQFNLY